MKHETIAPALDVAPSPAAAIVTYGLERQTIGAHAPLSVALAVIPSLPRSVLSYLVERAIERLDEIEGDVDLEDSEAGLTAIDRLGRYLPDVKIGFTNGEPYSLIREDDSEPGPWPEWETRGRHKTYGGAEMPNTTAAAEDAEDSDPLEETWREVSSWSGQSRRNMDPHGPDDAEEDDHGEDSHDREEVNEAEIQQMFDDVPCLRVYGLEPNIFNGERPFLGMSNLQPSFVASEMPPAA